MDLPKLDQTENDMVKLMSVIGKFSLDKTTI